MKYKTTEDHRKVMAFMKSRWTCMNVRCGNGKYHIDSKKNQQYTHIEIQVSREEFKAWCFAQSRTILALARPSIDRVDKTQHYTLANMRIVELAHNIRKDKTVFVDGQGTCFSCNQVLPEDVFVKSNRTANGRTSICRPCEATRSRARAGG